MESKINDLKVSLKAANERISEQERQIAKLKAQIRMIVRRDLVI